MSDSDFIPSSPGTERVGREEVLAGAIRRSIGVPKVVFDEDGEHVYVGPVEAKVLRHRLGTDAQQFLSGEFPLDAGELPDVTLHAPSGEEVR